MKICSVVGVRKSGKTTVVTSLVKELKKRGYRVGTVKTVFCPTFSIDKKGSNTAKHKDAGAEVVCAKAKNEMTIMYQGAMDDNEIFKKLDVEYLILEGDYEAAVPRIVCGHNEAELDERINKYAFAVSGQIAAKLNEYKCLEAVNVLENVAHLADLVEKNVTDIQLPIEMLETPGTVSSFCQCGCHKNENKQCKDNNEPVLKTKIERTDRKHIFLTGEKQIGKSTIIKELQKRIDDPLVGYETRQYILEGEIKGYYFHSINIDNIKAFENDSPISIRTGVKGCIPVTETFETLGVKTLKDAYKNAEKILIADEVGKLEKSAVKFQEQLFHCLNHQKLVLGVLQKTKSKIVEEIQKRPDVEVIEITEFNRDTIILQIIDKIRAYGINIK